MFFLFGTGAWEDVCYNASLWRLLLEEVPFTDFNVGADVIRLVRGRTGTLGETGGRAGPAPTRPLDGNHNIIRGRPSWKIAA